MSVPDSSIIRVSHATRPAQPPRREILPGSPPRQVGPLAPSVAPGEEKPVQPSRANMGEKFLCALGGRLPRRRHSSRSSRDPPGWGRAAIRPNQVFRPTIPSSWY